MVATEPAKNTNPILTVKNMDMVFNDMCLLKFQGVQMVSFVHFK